MTDSKLEDMSARLDSYYSLRHGVEFIPIGGDDDSDVYLALDIEQDIKLEVGQKVPLIIWRATRNIVDFKAETVGEVYEVAPEEARVEFPVPPGLDTSVRNPTWFVTTTPLTLSAVHLREKIMWGCFEDEWDGITGILHAACSQNKPAIGDIVPVVLHKVRGFMGGILELEISHAKILAEYRDEYIGALEQLTESQAMSLKNGALVEIKKDCKTSLAGMVTSFEGNAEVDGKRGLNISIHYDPIC